MNTEKLIKDYEEACNNIVKAFSKRYEVYCDTSDWVAEKVGGTICINEEFYLSIEEMILMFKTNISWDEYLRYWDYSYDCATLGLTNMNLESWIKGAPCHSKEIRDKIRKMREELNELIDNANKRQY